MSERGLAIAFALATACFWGVYGPALGFARTTQPVAAGGWSPFKPYVFIGIAYLVWGCVGGVIAMKAFGDSFSFSGTQAPAAKWGFIAGSLGAFGALTLTLAVVNAKNYGGPGLVMPIVFGGAVCVTAVTTLLLLKGQADINPMMWVGMLLVAIGIVLVAKNTPHPSKPPAKAAAASTITTPAVAEKH